MNAAHINNQKGKRFDWKQVVNAPDSYVVPESMPIHPSKPDWRVEIRNPNTMSDVDWNAFRQHLSQCDNGAISPSDRFQVPGAVISWRCDSVPGATSAADSPPRPVKQKKGTLALRVSPKKVFSSGGKRPTKSSANRGPTAKRKRLERSETDESEAVESNDDEPLGCDNTMLDYNTSDSGSSDSDTSSDSDPDSTSDSHPAPSAQKRSAPNREDMRASSPALGVVQPSHRPARSVSPSKDDDLSAVQPGNDSQVDQLSRDGEPTDEEMDDGSGDDERRSDNRHTTARTTIGRGFDVTLVTAGFMSPHGLECLGPSSDLNAVSPIHVFALYG